MSDISVEDRSLPMSQGVIETGGSANLHREFESEYHEPSQHPCVTPKEGPQAEDGSAYKAEGSAPTVARMSGHQVQETSGASTAVLDKGAVRQEAAPGGPITARPDQPRFSGVSFKR